MGTSPQSRKFRINPVELVIFSTISLMLVNSLYHLFNERTGTQASPWAALTAPGGRTARTGIPSTVASSTDSAPVLMSYDLACEAIAETSTQAGKVRINGILCGQAVAKAGEGRAPASPPDAGRIIKVEILNQANQFSATVFTDSSAAKFSTDYIPLNQGSNPIQVVFHGADGKQTLQSLKINRN